MQPDWNTIVSVLAVLSPFLLILLSGVGWLYKHEKEHREAIEHQLSEHKYKAYITLLDIFFKAMKAIHTGNTINQNDLIDRMFDANKDLIIYGSDDVVNTYQKWLSSVRDSVREGKINEREQQLEKLEKFGEIVISIRRDMGNPKTNITSEKVLRQFITDYDLLQKK